MGCCELRGDQSDAFTGQIGIRKINRSRRAPSALVGVTKRVSFGPSLTGELRHSLAKLVPELTQQSEPDLFGVFKYAEDLLVIDTWTKNYDKDWVLVKHQTHPIFDTVFYVQLDLKQICLVEDILNVFNNPTLRVVWDPEFNAMYKIQGHDILDSKVFVQKKGDLNLELTRYVRYYNDQVVVIETDCEHRGLSKMSKAIYCVFISVSHKSTIVEVVTSEKTDSIEAAVSKKKLWAARLFQEIVKESLYI